MENKDVQLLLNAINSMDGKIEARFEAIDQRFEALNESINHRFELMNEKNSVEFESIRSTIGHMNTKIDWIHDDNKEISRQNKKIEEELVKPIQNKTSIKYIQFTSVWGFMTILLGMIGGALSIGFARAVS